MYWTKLSIPGKQNAELSYVFADELIEQKNSSVLLFGMFDVKSTSDIYHTIIKQTVKHFLDFYHSVSPFDSVASEEMPDSTEFIFENSIQYTYEKVSDALQYIQEHGSGRQHIDIKKISCVLGALINDTLYLSLTGAGIQPLLIYPVSHGRGSVHYVLMNIAESGGVSANEPHTRLFPQLINGSVAIPSSCVMLCNQTFLDYISPQQIKQVLSNSKPQNVLPYFEHLLSRVHARNDFSGLLIARDAEPAERQRQRPSAPASSLSMKDLNGTAESTRSILAPTVRPLLSRILKLLWMLFVKCLIVAFRACRNIYFFLIAPEQMRAYRAAQRAVFSFIKTGWSHIPKTASVFEKKAASFRYSLEDGALKDGFLQAWKSYSAEILAKYNASRSWFLSLNSLSKALLLLSILFISLFLVSLFNIQLNNSSQRKTSRAQEILSAVKQKITAADARLIYDDRGRARELVNESRQLLALIDDERFKIQEEYRNGKRDIEALERKINNITRVDSPTLLGSIPSTPESPTTDVRLLSSGQATVLFNNDAIYAYDSEKKELTELGLREKIPSISCATVKSKNEFYFCNADGTRLYALSFPDKTVSSFSVARKDESAPNALLVYNTRIYSFNSKSGSLLRHVKNGQSYSAGVPWFKGSPEQTAGARDIAIDGLVYIMTKNGELLTFSSGVRVKTDIPKDTASALEGAGRIITNSETPYLFALDAANKKIIAIHKQTFALAGQIVSPVFERPSDIALSNKKNTVLLTDAGRLFSLPFSFK